MNKKQIKWVAAVLFMSAVAVVAAGVQSASAASKCWQVDCNVCCRDGGKTLCTQRACP